MGILTAVSNDYGYQLMVVLEVKILDVATSSLQKSKSDFFSIFELPLTHLWILMTFTRIVLRPGFFYIPVIKVNFSLGFLDFHLCHLSQHARLVLLSEREKMFWTKWDIVAQQLLSFQLLPIHVHLCCYTCLTSWLLADNVLLVMTASSADSPFSKFRAKKIAEYGHLILTKWA